MGYTHYWKNVKFSDSGFKSYKDMVALLIKNLPKSVQVENDLNPELPMVGTFVRFNGVGELSHETFLIQQENSDFEFCKTNRKPYDLLVCGSLILASLFADSGEISSDGIGEPYCDSEWKDAWAFVCKVVEFASVDPARTLRLFRVPSQAMIA